jgi:hypothetical protein
MNSIRMTAIAVSIAAAACSQPSAPAPSATEAHAQTPPASAKPDAATQPSSDTRFIEAAALVGRWGDNGDCARDIVFHPDGTFASYTGGTGRWSLSGDVMTMSGSGGTFQVRVQAVGADRLEIQNPDGSIGTSQRC